jgi:hypothetical protein
MSINISKELAYYADSKYIKFIIFIVTHQKLRALENWCLKKGKHPIKVLNLNENHTIRFSVSENPYDRGFKLPYEKVLNFLFFARRKMTDAFLLLLFLLLLLL